jgi:hypothetical protein
MTDNTRTNTDRLLAAWRRGEHDLATLRAMFLSETGDARAADERMTEFLVAADIDPRQGL